MATFILVPGAGGEASYWHPVATRLERGGHEAIAVDLPGDDPTQGLPAYAARVTAAIGARHDVVLVAQSLGGFTAACVASNPAVRRIVFVNAMIPTPHETPGAWWGNTGSEAARIAAAREGGYPEGFDLETYFLHDLPPDMLAETATTGRPEAQVVFRNEADFERWPAIPLHVVVGRDDRFFPRSFQIRSARERLGADVDVHEVPGGHLAALSQPDALSALLTELARR